MAFLNIVGNGMGGGAIEQNLADMQAQPTAEMALKYKGLIVGIKSAHYNGPEWDPYIQAEEAGKIANIPVMVDFGSARVRTIAELFQKYFRPSDIYTHAYSGGRWRTSVTCRLAPRRISRSCGSRRASLDSSISGADASMAPSALVASSR
jgi:predicted amidohydrolase